VWVPVWWARIIPSGLSQLRKCAGLTPWRKAGERRAKDETYLEHSRAYEIRSQNPVPKNNNWATLARVLKAKNGGPNADFPFN